MAENEPMVVDSMLLKPQDLVGDVDINDFIKYLKSERITPKEIRKWYNNAENEINKHNKSL